MRIFSNLLTLILILLLPNAPVFAHASHVGVVQHALQHSLQHLGTAIVIALIAVGIAVIELRRRQ